MEERKDLYWISQISPEGRNWITVTPSEGFGDMTNVNITVSEDTTYSNATSATVTFICTSCKKRIEKPITVCRCLCDCERITVSPLYDTETNLIPDTGLGAGEVIASYIISNRCGDKISATIEYEGKPCDCEDLTIDGPYQTAPAQAQNGNSSTSSDSGYIIEDLLCENGNIKLINPIPVNPSFNEITYTVKVYYGEEGNKKECENKEFEFKQKGTICDCGTVEINWKENLSIPITGLPYNYTLGTYSLTKEVCALRLKGHVTQIERSTVDIPIRFSGTDILLDGVIEPNKIQSDRNYVFSVTFDGISDDCTPTKTVKQPHCTCNSNFNITEKLFDDSTKLMPVTGLTASTVIATYELTDGCSMLLPTGTIDEVPLKFENGQIKLTSDIGNDITTGKIYNVIINFNGTNNCKNYSIKQASCSCEENVSDFTNITSFEDSGATSGKELASYILNGEGCTGVKITGTMTEGTNTYELIYGQRDGRDVIGLYTDIYCNTGQTKTFKVNLTYNGKTCHSFDITQPGANVCDYLIIEGPFDVNPNNNNQNNNNNG